MDMSFPDEPCITVERYNVAVRLIQNFDELETKEQRSDFAQACIRTDQNSCLQTSFFQFVFL